MGPLVSEGQLRSVDRYVRHGVRSGCALLTGGKPIVEHPERQGYYYAPTVFDRVPHDSPLATEEIFGPVLPVLRVRDLDEAITIANSTRYGLAASVFTSQPGRHPCVHEPGAGRHDPRQPRHGQPGARALRRRQGFRTGRVLNRADRQRVLYKCQSHLRQVVGRRGAEGPDLEPLSETLLGARAYRALWNDIVRGRIEFGAQLRPDTIAEQLDISTTPVREALHRMEADGLIVKLPYRGWFVREFTEQEVRELYEMRAALESLQRQARVRAHHGRRSWTWLREHQIGRRSRAERPATWRRTGSTTAICTPRSWRPRGMPICRRRWDS